MSCFDTKTHIELHQHQLLCVGEQILEYSETSNYYSLDRFLDQVDHRVVFQLILQLCHRQQAFFCTVGSSLFKKKRVYVTQRRYYLDA